MKTAGIQQLRRSGSTSHLFTHINEGNTPADCLFDAWRDITSPFYDTTARTRNTTHAAEVAARMAGELFVGRVVYHPCFTGAVAVI